MGVRRRVLSVWCWLLSCVGGRGCWGGGRGETARLVSLALFVLIVGLVVVLDGFGKRAMLWFCSLLW